MVEARVPAVVGDESLPFTRARWRRGEGGGAGEDLLN